MSKAKGISESIKRSQISLAATGLLSFALLGGLSWAVMSVSLYLGRTTPATASLAWVVRLTGGCAAILLIAILFWWVLVRKCSVATGKATMRVGGSLAVFVLCVPLLIGLYRSDTLFHYLVYNQIPRDLVLWTPPTIALLMLEANVVLGLPVSRRIESRLRRGKSIPVLLFAAFSLLYLFTAGGHLYSPDEKEMYHVTEAMADGSFPLSRDDAIAAAGEARQPFSKYGLVPSLLGLPPYLVAKAFGLEPDRPSAAFPIPNGSYPLVDLLVNPLSSALGVVLLYSLARTLTFGATASIVVALVYGLATSSWVYSKTFFSQPSSATFLLAATFFALRRGRNPVRDFAFSGTFLGLAAGSRVEVLLIAVPLTACLMRAIRADRDTGIRSAIAFGLMLAVVAGITVGWYDFIKTGSVLSTGHAHQETLAGFSPRPYIGLFGSIFSSGFGFVTYNPVVAMGAIAFPLFALQHRFEAWTLGTMMVIAIALYGSFGDWSGGFTWANRYLVVILPFSVLPVGVYLDRRWRDVPWIVLLAGASVLGFAINLLAVLFDFNVGWLDLWDHGASLLQIQWDAHFSPIGAHVRLLGNFLTTGAKLDLYLLHRLGLPALIVTSFLVVLLISMVLRTALDENERELDLAPKRDRLLSRSP